MAAELKAPLVYPGGKSRVAPEVWRRLGNVATYAEPFCGSAAVLLGRPHWPFAAGTGRFECINDLHSKLVNAWRAIQGDPEGVARWADNPAFEADVIARHYWNNTEGEKRCEKIKTDPHYYDVEAAGIWLWLHSIWVGYAPPIDGKFDKPINAKMPTVGAEGVNRFAIEGEAGAFPGEDVAVGTCERRRLGLVRYLRRLRDRLRHVWISCGSWDRILSRAVLHTHGEPVGIFLDPPYCGKDRSDVYAHESYSVAKDVRAWCAENGDDKRLRIALCGYDGEYELPGEWRVYKWKAVGGYGNQRKDGENRNAGRERIWFSPHCLIEEQETLFDEPAAPEVEAAAEDEAVGEEVAGVAAPAEVAAAVDDEEELF